MRTARHAVADALRRCDEDVVHAAALLASELVTNAILHARTAVEVVVTPVAHGVRIEVSDDDPALPSRREIEQESTTGRGLALVELLARSFGVEARPDGKVVWFELSCDREATPGHGEGEWASDVADPARTRVELEDLPVALYRALRQHTDALLREYELLELQGAAGLRSSEEVTRAAHAHTCVAAAIDEALPALSGRADLAVDLPLAVVDDLRALRSVLDDAEARARAGQMLAHPGLPEVRRLLHWCCEEMERQAAGDAPTAWQPISSADAAPPRTAPTWDAAEVTAATTGVVAADDSNRIIAVSAPAAELLGWSAEELVGRRVTTIVPPELREAHIAGFTRYLTSGVGSVIGQEVALPALRRDGQRVPVLLHLVAQPLALGRTVILAHLSPAPEPSPG